MPFKHLNADNPPSHLHRTNHPTQANNTPFIQCKDTHTYLHHLHTNHMALGGTDALVVAEATATVTGSVTMPNIIPIP
jgi:hypothetical protein